MKNKNWIGNLNSIYKTLGASNHTVEDREENDYYATDPRAAELLLELETFHKNIWEPACGEGYLSEVFKKARHKVLSTDLIYRGYGKGDVDFLNFKGENKWHGDIITNPPYKFAQDFVEKGISLIKPNNKLALFLKIQFLEGKKRKKLFEKYPPKTVYVSSSRLLCAKNGKFAPIVNGRRIAKQGYVSSSAVAYAWFVWVKEFKGAPIIRWFN